MLTGYDGGDEKCSGGKDNLAMDAPQPWHRLFGLSWMDFFRGMPVSVDMEKDLSHKRQLLDVLIVRKEAGPLPCRLPDGFDDLAAHNLISFKSYQETLDGWTLNELVGHYVNYRKRESPSMQDLLPETDFRLFAVSVRFPTGLAQRGALTQLQAGVYEVRHFTGTLRLVVIHQLPQEEHNAMLHLFSAQAEALRYGTEHYRQRSEQTTTLLLQLFNRYRLEGLTMPDALEQMARDTIDELLRSLSPEERLKGLSDDDLRKRLSPEARVAGLSAEERLKGLPAEERLRGLSTEDLLAALPPEAREALARRLNDRNSSSNPD
jgi:hypothetical protein